jgi:hypothetical protein
MRAVWIEQVQARPRGRATTAGVLDALVVRAAGVRWLAGEAITQPSELLWHRVAHRRVVIKARVALELERAALRAGA